MRLKSPLLLLFLVVLLNSTAVHAQPLTFSWVDFSGHPQHLTLDIAAERLQRGMLHDRDQVGLPQVQQRVYVQAIESARLKSTSDMQFTITGSPQSFDVQATATPALEDYARRTVIELLEGIKASVADPGSDSYFIYDAASKGIRPDYNLVAADNQDLFAAFAQALLARFGPDSPVELINQLLAFLQTIPYDDMLNSNFPMATPVQMLVENRGDCEGKQTFLVGVLGHLFQDRPLFLINLPDQEHILAGIGLESDYASGVKHNGQSVVLMDATGPGHFPFGVIPGFFHNNNQSVWHAYIH
jgi:hypothetical protein